MPILTFYFIQYLKRHQFIIYLEIFDVKNFLLFVKMLAKYLSYLRFLKDFFESILLKHRREDCLLRTSELKIPGSRITWNRDYAKTITVGIGYVFDYDWNLF